MNSRRIVQDALNHRHPERVPVDFGGTGQTGIHISCVDALRDYYGLKKQPVKAAVWWSEDLTLVKDLTWHTVRVE